MIINSTAAAAITSLNTNQMSFDKSSHWSPLSDETATPVGGSGEVTPAEQGINATDESQTAGSCILDTDAAWKTASFATESILGNSDVAMLAQASGVSSSLLSLLE